jgi:SAM-dependent methyltransferase
VREESFRTKKSKTSLDVIGFYDDYALDWRSFLEIADLKDTYRVIELGVGTGAYLDTIAPLVKEVICIDGSVEMLNVLKEKHHNISNLRLYNFDLEKRIEDLITDADLVYCFGLLEHIIELDPFLNNIKCFLRKGGRVLFVTPNAKCIWYGKLRHVYRAGKHCSTDEYYSKKQIDELMLKSGFIPSDVRYWGYFPAGVTYAEYKILESLGRIIDKTPLRKYAGGLTVSYIW